MDKSLFITCSQGFEPLLIEELNELGFTQCKEGFRGVYVPFSSMSDVYRINYLSRIGGRVLLPLAEFRCYDSRTLYKGAGKIDWSKLIKPGKTFAIDSNVTHRSLRNSLFAAQVVKDSICDQLREKTGERPNVQVQNPDVQINLFIHNEQAVISLDTSGEPLYKRGYRLAAGEAPIQESVAAAFLRKAKYTPDDILIDPCCGSGTFLIEAALIATKTPPGYLRKQWGFMAHPDFNNNDWIKVRAEADGQKVDFSRKKIWGIEINKSLVQVAKTNLRAAGVLPLVEIITGDFRDIEPNPAPTLLISNPPHGKRLDDESSLRPLYRSLGDFMKRKLAKPSKAYVFTSSLELSKEIGLAPKKRYVFTVSGMEARFLEFDIY